MQTPTQYITDTEGVPFQSEQHYITMSSFSVQGGDPFGDNVKLDQGIMSGKHSTVSLCLNGVDLNFSSISSGGPDHIYKSSGPEFMGGNNQNRGHASRWKHQGLLQKGEPHMVSYPTSALDSPLLQRCYWK